MTEFCHIHVLSNELVVSLTAAVEAVTVGEDIDSFWLKVGFQFVCEFVECLGCRAVWSKQVIESTVHNKTDHCQK